jgi:hypothetical protein
MRTSNPVVIAPTVIARLDRATQATIIQPETAAWVPRSSRGMTSY